MILRTDTHHEYQQQQTPAGQQRLETMEKMIQELNNRGTGYTLKSGRLTPLVNGRTGETTGYIKN